MQADRFTIKTQEALAAAQRLAEERANPQLAPEHLLIVLLEQEGGVAVPVKRMLGTLVLRLPMPKDVGLKVKPSAEGVTA